MLPQTTLVVIGLIQQADQILLVQQQDGAAPAPYWVCPGGRVEPGESLSEALVREIAEETGLRVQTIGPLAYCTQIDHPQRQAQTLAFAFPILQWEGTPTSCDPDDKITAVRWVARSDALVWLQAIGWAGMREPLLAYLRGAAPSGTCWQYREGAEGQMQIGCVQGTLVH